jgi:hypothetical protein
MIYAPSEVPLKSVSVVIPIRILDFIGVELAKHIDEAPCHGIFVRHASVDVEIDVVHALFGMIDVNWFGSDIQITKPDHRFVHIERNVKVGAKTAKPVKLRAYFSEEIEYPCGT